MRIAIFIIASIAVIVGVFVLTSPFPQPLSYHNFADQRTIAGIPHACNVVSNLPFVLVGIWGIIHLLQKESRSQARFTHSYERLPFWAYFIGLALTGIGSAYYHADPNNQRLVWDRLPLTIAFMGLFTSVLAERIDIRLAKWLLGPLVLAGMASVTYWDHTERIGEGDLRFYFVVQFYPLLALIALIVFFRPRYTSTSDLIGSLAAYGVAKLTEALDERIYSAAVFVSGHTIKHLVAGLGAYLILRMIQKRVAI